ncbi:hypothetical protein SARC_00804 [Sphaeroforma arctica JP610]|uniref:Uncharacterized protein n=1 Tax=Sphaeroforma arctica JP610 TaxID=667725 RepID=A0A0L0GDJ2_9EUKA|nr:hypothetical protein SARC_00804 [Sphaeroforma arctica JP610]KNC87060.1 hypothetical protein SARC_00804 [Sphaeroforma arctica JP610]|eukprot:XP_014160962.1 hypothetical protein SARC_00804 [Sphaeroforma arctica JP610]
MNPIWLPDSASNHDSEVRKRLLDSFDKATKNYYKGASAAKSREVILQVWVLFNKLEGIERVKGGTRQDSSLMQRVNIQLYEVGMGLDRAVEHTTRSIMSSRRETVRVRAAANASGPIKLDFISETYELLVKSKAVD